MKVLMYKLLKVKLGKTTLGSPLYSGAQYEN